MQTEIIKAGQLTLTIEHFRNGESAVSVQGFREWGTSRDAAVAASVALLEAMTAALLETPSPESLRAVTGGPK